MRRDIMTSWQSGPPDLWVKLSAGVWFRADEVQAVEPGKVWLRGRADPITTSVTDSGYIDSFVKRLAGAVK